MADRKNFSEFIGIQENHISRDIKNHKKEHLLDLIKKSKKSNLKNRVFPKTLQRNRDDKYAKDGEWYNFELRMFVEEKWDPNEALENSPSLEYLIRKIKKIKEMNT